MKLMRFLAAAGSLWPRARPGPASRPTNPGRPSGRRAIVARHREASCRFHSHVQHVRSPPGRPGSTRPSRSTRRVDAGASTGAHQRRTLRSSVSARLAATSYANPGRCRRSLRAGRATAAHVPGATYHDAVPSLRASRKDVIRSLPVLGASSWGRSHIAPVLLPAARAGLRDHLPRLARARPDALDDVPAGLAAASPFSAVPSTSLGIGCCSPWASCCWPSAGWSRPPHLTWRSHGRLRIFLALGLQLTFVGVSTAIARRYAGVAGLALGVALRRPRCVAVFLPLAAGGSRRSAGAHDPRVSGDVAAGRPFVWLISSGGGDRPRLAPDGAGVPRDFAPASVATSRSRSAQRLAPDALRHPADPRVPDPLVGAVGIAASTKGSTSCRSRHLEAQDIFAAYAAVFLRRLRATRTWWRGRRRRAVRSLWRRSSGSSARRMIAVGNRDFMSPGSKLALAMAGYVVYGFASATITLRSAAFSDVFGVPDLARSSASSPRLPGGGNLVMNVGSVFYDRLGNYGPYTPWSWSRSGLVIGPCSSRTRADGLGRGCGAPGPACPV